ncbi:MAG: choice-of-anchor J domain-containing protein [Aquaticitalea sp.]
MKKVIYLLVIMGLAITGCNPLEDINNEIDAQGNAVLGIDEITLTSDDYAALVDQDDDEDPDYYETNEAFADLDDARATLPAFLSDRYPFYGEGSSVTVHFNLYDGNPEDVSAFVNAEVYNLGPDDYVTALSNAFLPSEDVDGELDNILDNQFPTPTEGQVVRLGYNVFTAEPVAGFANIFEAVFPDDFDDFEVISVSGPEALGWTVGSSNIQGSGFTTMANDVEEWVVSPEIDLTDASNLLFQITQEIDFLGDPSLIDILISSDYTTGGDVMAATWTPFAFDKTLFADMTPSEDYDFSAYDGQAIHVGLKYSSTTSDSPRWRVQSFAFKTPGLSGDRDAKSAYYKYSEGSWSSVNDVYYLSTADYDSMGENSGQPGQFNNFSSTVLPSNYIPQFLSMEYPFAQQDDEIFIIYRYFGGSSVGTVTKGNLYTFNNGTWMQNTSSLQFGYENGVWVPDNTIRYTFTGSDYTTVGAALINEPGFEAAAGNLNSFGNFNRTGGSTNWSDPMMVTAVGIILDNIDPSAAEGQKYIVTVNVYVGSNSTLDVRVVKRDGEWVAN